MVIKVKALKLSTFVEDLVKEEFTDGSIDQDAEGGGIDYELCLHQDYLFMLRQRKKSQICSPLGANQVFSHNNPCSSYSTMRVGYREERAICAADIIE